MTKYTDDILSETDQDALKIIEDTWTKSDAHYQTQFADMRRQLKIYYLKIYDYGVTQQDLQTSTPLVSELPEIFYPVVRAVCDTTLAGIRGTIMPDEYDWLEVKPWNAEMGAEELAIIKAFMNFRLQQMGYAKKMERHILQAMQMRWSVCLTDWRIRPGYVRLRQPERVEAARIIKQQGIKGLLERFNKWMNKGDIDAGFEHDPYKINRSNFTVLPTFDTRPDWRYPDLDDSRFFIYDQYLPWQVLEKGEYSRVNPDGQYHNISELKDWQKDNRADSEPLESEKVASDIKRAPTDPLGLPDGLRVRHYLADNAWITCDHEYRAIISKRRLAGLPLVKLTYGKAMTSFDEDSALQIMEPLQMHVNYVVSIRQENQDRRVRKVIGINKDMLVDQEQSISLRPGDEIVEFWGDTRQCLSSIDFPDVSAGWQEDVQFLIDAITRLSGMDVNAQALYYAKHKPTATETDRVRDAMMSRLGRWQKEIETDNISESVTQLYSLEDAFFDEEMMLTIFGSDATFYPLMSRQVFDIVGGNVQFFSRGSLYWQTKREELAFIEQAFQMAASSPALQQGVKFDVLFIDILRKGGLTDPEKYIVDRSDRAYTVRPDLEHKLIASGQKFPIGDLDDHQVHMQDHQAFLQAVETGQISPIEFPIWNIPRLEAHIQEHQQAMAGAMTTNASGVGLNPLAPSGQLQLPQETSGTITANQGNVQTPIGV